MRRRSSASVFKTTRKYLKGKNRAYCVTIVPADGATKPKSLTTDANQRFIRRTKDKLARAYDGVFLGAVDWSMNESKKTSYAPFWCQHVHGLAITMKATTN